MGSLARKILTIGCVCMAPLIASPAWAVPVIVDLTTNDSGTISGVQFEFDQTQPTGTGVLDPFLRIQRNGTEQGYNTTVSSAGALPFDEKFGVWTHDLQFSAMTAIEGFFQFVLDIGEPVSGTESLLSLDGLKFFKTDTPGQNAASTDSNGDANGLIGTLLWDMDAADYGNHVLLDANRDGKPGNGVSDMLMKVPEHVFSGVLETEYVILWSRFGLQDSATAGSGSFGTFEEWSHVTSDASVPVPEPGSWLLLGAGLVAIASFRRWRPDR